MMQEVHSGNRNVLFTVQTPLTYQNQKPSFIPEQKSVTMTAFALKTEVPKSQHFSCQTFLVVSSCKFASFYSLKLVF